MERGTRFELAHPRVEALVHSLFYVTLASVFANMREEYMNYSQNCQIYFCFFGKYMLVWSHIISLFLIMKYDFSLNIFHDFVQQNLNKIETLGPKVIAVVLIMVIGTVISYGIYKLTMYIFKKFHIIDIIDSIWAGFEEHTSNIVDKNTPPAKKWEKTPLAKANVNTIRYDRITAKAFSYYVFLLFFRWSVVILGVTEVEKFMQDLLAYLPSLFVWILIWFFGIRFANSVHDIIYQALELTKQKTSSIIAMGAKIIIMFFTLMIMLNYIKIVDEFIINALFLGFITTLTISFSLAFGLWGREIAREILESFRK